jgi:hypothetical protein
MLEKGRIERIAANRVVICTMTEFGLVNDRSMSVGEFSRFIESTQMTTGNLSETEEDIKKRHDRKKKSIIKAIESIKLPMLTDSVIRDAAVESIA